ncbi:MAG: hypothetical protein WA303_13645 [Bradyrhizobium sp.]
MAVRDGGHNMPGFGSVDDGLVIDLSMMKGVPRRRVAASLMLVGSHSRSIANRLRSANEQNVSAPS